MSNLVSLLKEHLENAWYEGYDYKVQVTQVDEDGVVEVYYPDEDRRDVFKISVEEIHDERDNLS